MRRDVASYEELKRRVQQLPPPTEREQKLQRFDWVYGNLACSTNHKQDRETFRTWFAREGFTSDEFEEWSREREWQ